jgi:uncharacterized membrane protein
MISISPQATVFLLALTVAVTWGFSPILEKRGLSRGGNPVQASVVFVGVSVFLYWATLLVFRGGSSLTSLNTLVVSVFGVAGFIGTALGRVAIFEGVKRVGPSISSAGVSARPVFSGALAWVWLGERLTVSQLTGITVLVVGLVLLSVSDGGDIGGWNRSDLLLPVGAAGFFGLGFVIRRFGLSEFDITPLQAVAVNETAALLSLILFASLNTDTKFNTSKKSYIYFILAGVITAIGLLAFFTALSIPEGKVASVDPIAATAPLFTVFFSRLSSRTPEKITRRLLLGLVLTVLGAILIAA